MKKWFQFHKGSIKTHSIGGSSVSTHVFQFHKGSIKTRGDNPMTRAFGISIP